MCDVCNSCLRSVRSFKSTSNFRLFVNFLALITEIILRIEFEYSLITKINSLHKINWLMAGPPQQLQSHGDAAVRARRRESRHA